MDFKAILLALVIIFLVPAVSATEAAFKYVGSDCTKNGTASINFLHLGRLVYAKDLSVFITYDVSGKTPVPGVWVDGTGNKMEFARSALSSAELLSFEAAEGAFTKQGQYTMRLEFPKSADPNKRDYVDFEMECPGIFCSSSFQCRDDEICSNNTCIPLNCNSCQVGVANRCVAKCTDNNPCTLDLCNAGSCSYEPIKNCCITDKDCDDKKSCTTDTCSSNKCQYAPVQCSASKDPCTRGICSEPVGCEYKTNPLCPLSNNTERTYVVNVGEPEITTSSQSFLGKIISLLSGLFK